MESLRSRSIIAFTRIELLVTIACVVLVVALLLPSLARSMARSKRTNCTNHMKQIGLAFRLFAVDHNNDLPMGLSLTNGGTMELIANGLVFPHFQAISNELSAPKVLRCPSDTERTCPTNFGNDLVDSKLSYFVYLDAVDGEENSLLCGDRDLTNRASVGSPLVCASKSTPLGWTTNIHREQGNICFADGAVNGFANGSVHLTARLSEGITNRLAVP